MKPETIEDYIAASPAEAQNKLQQLHECILNAAPGATQELKWNMPAYSYKRILVTFAIFKNHIGFYPTPSVISFFAKQLTDYKTAASSVQFPLNKPLPLNLVSKMVEFRVNESLLGDVKWK